VSYSVFCTACGHRHPDEGCYLYGCPACGSILDVAYDLDALRPRWDSDTLARRPTGIGRWRELLPLARDEAIVSLGEGDTPLIDVPAAELGCPGVRLLLKLELCNPSGSFKDRAIAVAISKARAAGAGAAVISSTGNAGASLAAYSALLGLACYVLVPAATPPKALAQIAGYGARLIRVQGDISGPFRLAREAAARFGWANLATTYLSPYPTEGDKTAGFEIAMQLGWRCPDWILVPVGDGPLLYACYKAFVELRALGLVDRLPRMGAIQAAGCAPIYRAWQAGEDEVRAWGEPDTVAKGIADPLNGYPRDGTFTLRAVRASGGTVVAVGDDEILAARDSLMRRAGVMTEPTGAVPLAGLRRMLAHGQVSEGQVVALLITGHGLKQSAEMAVDWPVIRADIEALDLVVADMRESSPEAKKREEVSQASEIHGVGVPGEEETLRREAKK
jgi:threonine synthase